MNVDYYSYLLEKKDTFIGKNSDCDIIIDDTKVKQNQACIIKDSIISLNKANVLVNNILISKLTPLKHLDIISIESYNFIVLQEEENTFLFFDKNKLSFNKTEEVKTISSEKKNSFLAEFSIHLKEVIASLEQQNLNNEKILKSLKEQERVNNEEFAKHSSTLDESSKDQYRILQEDYKAKILTYEKEEKIIVKNLTFFSNKLNLVNKQSLASSTLQKNKLAAANNKTKLKRTLNDIKKVEVRKKALFQEILIYKKQLSFLKKEDNNQEKIKILNTKIFILEKKIFKLNKSLEEDKKNLKKYKRLSKKPSKKLEVTKKANVTQTNKFLLKKVKESYSISFGSSFAFMMIFLFFSWLIIELFTSNEDVEEYAYETTYIEEPKPNEKEPVTSFEEPNNKKTEFEAEFEEPTEPQKVNESKEEDSSMSSMVDNPITDNPINDYGEVPEDFTGIMDNSSLGSSNGTGNSIGDSDIGKRIDKAGGSRSNDLDIRVSLVWDSTKDIDLHLSLPSKEEVWYENKIIQKTHFIDNGSEPKEKRVETLYALDIDANFDNRTNTPVENIVALKDKAQDGKYSIWVKNPIGDNNMKFKLEIYIKGLLYTTDYIKTHKNQLLVFSFEYYLDKMPRVLLNPYRAKRTGKYITEEYL